MEENVGGTITKKIWDLVCVAFFMIKKGISKKKTLLDLNFIMKRRQLAAKSLRHLIFHHHHHSAHTVFDDVEAVNKVMEIMTASSACNDVAASHELGFRRSPMVRQLRVTDSPFPVQVCPDESSRVVDQAAEDFINNFYSRLKQQYSD